MLVRSPLSVLMYIISNTQAQPRNKSLIESQALDREFPGEFGKIRRPRKSSTSTGELFKESIESWNIQDEWVLHFIHRT